MAGSVRRVMRPKWMVPILGVIAALGVGVVPALAKTIEREHYSGVESFSFDDCGFTLNGQSTFSGHALLRVDKGGEAFLVKDRFSYEDVITNPATGKYFVIQGHGLFHEIKAKLVEGTIYEFKAVEAGQPFAIYDSDGNEIVRDRGVIRHTFLFDTQGDGQPGGEFLEETEAVVHGPHPGFADDFPFCEIAAELTGA
jgi:hypothetical protein